MEFKSKHAIFSTVEFEVDGKTMAGKVIEVIASEFTMTGEAK